MKNLRCLIFICFGSISGYAQTLDFTLASPQPNIMEAYGGTFASGDIDGDGDKDLLMSGLTPQIYTKLYTNDGAGNFTEVATTFPRTGNGQAFFKDLDNDGDLDLFFSGQDQLTVVFTNIYSNDGSGVFTLVTNTALPKISSGAAMADVDNDGDQDIVISAQTSTNAYVADVYLNNGNAVFTAQGSTAFTAVRGALEFIDIENDGDLDVLISGKDVNNISSIKLYQNDGSGNYTLNSNSTFEALNGEDIDVADTDNDGDFDFLVCGKLNNNARNMLYINNGSGVFAAISTNLQQTFGGKNAMADLDNDGDQDILIVGTQDGGLPNIFNIVYQNTGNNAFVQTEILGGEYIANCVVDDFTGDGLKDIIIQGFADDTNVYWNTSTVLSNASEVESNQALTYFPNPTNGMVTIEGLNTASPVRIINAMGELVAEVVVSPMDNRIDFSRVPGGIYYMVLEGRALKIVRL